MRGDRDRGSAKVLFWTSVAAYAILICWLATTLPDRVPAKTGFNGVERWGSRTEFVAVATGTGALMVALLGLPWWRKVPKSLVNVPHKAYWIRPENWPVALDLVAEDLARIGTMIMMFLGFTMWQTAEMAYGRMTQPWLMPVALGVFLTAVLGYTVWMSLGSRYRPEGR